MQDRVGCDPVILVVAVCLCARALATVLQTGYFWNFSILNWLGGPSGKAFACQHRRSRRHSFDPWVRMIP